VDAEDPVDRLRFRHRSRPPAFERAWCVMHTDHTPQPGLPDAASRRQTTLSHRNPPRPVVARLHRNSGDLSHRKRCTRGRRGRAEPGVGDDPAGRALASAVRSEPGRCRVHAR
jgi:hypothetical protein